MTHNRRFKIQGGVRFRYDGHHRHLPGRMRLSKHIHVVRRRRTTAQQFGRFGQASIAHPIVHRSAGSRTEQVAKGLRCLLGLLLSFAASTCLNGLLHQLSEGSGTPPLQFAMDRTAADTADGEMRTRALFCHCLAASITNRALSDV